MQVLIAQCLHDIKRIHVDAVYRCSNEQTQTTYCHFGG